MSAVFGVAFALGQHDLKRLLAYHSIENIGIILMGLGVALIGVAEAHPMWVLFGMAGCLLHVWNHRQARLGAMGGQCMYGVGGSSGCWCRFGGLGWQ